MPVKPCQENGKKGYKWGDSVKCYTYTPGNEASREAAKKKAIRQGRAIQVNKFKLKEIKSELELLSIEISNLKNRLG